MLKVREKCNEFTRRMHEFTDKKLLTEYYNLRGLPEEVFKDNPLFYMPDVDVSMIDEFNIYELGLENIKDRIVIPVKDVEGNIMGFSGYNMDLSPKYLDSSTAYYNPKETAFFGMEKIVDVLNNNKKLFITEGIVDSLVLSYLGVPAVAMSNANINKTLSILMQNVRCCYIGDNDTTGIRVIRDIHNRYKSCDCYVYKSIGKLKDTNDAYIFYGKTKLQAQIYRIAYDKEPDDILEKL